MLSQFKIISVYLVIINVVYGIDSEYELSTNKKLTNTEDELINNEEEIGSGDNEIDLSKCEHLTTNNDSYTFYPVEDIKNDRGFLLRFRVKAERCVHIIFSSTNSTANSDHKGFEVVISGGEDDAISEIRTTRASKKNTSHTHYEKNMVSSKEWRQFWIRITSDGTLIEVGKKDSIPFMSSRTEPWLIEYFGFASDNNPINLAFLRFEGNNIDVSQYRTLTTYDGDYTFYPIEELKNDEGFFLKFLVKTDLDANIIFAPTNETMKKDEKIFKVILGGYTTNTISAIKTSELGEPGSEHHEKDILSPDEWRQFWIRISTDEASIEVGKNGSAAFMSLETEPRAIKYYGFAGGNSFTYWAFPRLQNNNIERNVCIPSPCGPNSECKQKDNHAICSCKRNQFGSPSTCRLECIFDSECPQNKACIGKTCQDPCAGRCGKNSKCEVDSHVPICSCLEGLTGDPLTECVEEKNFPKYRSGTNVNGCTLYPISVIKNGNEIFMNFNVKSEGNIKIIFSSTNHDSEKVFEVILNIKWNGASTINSYGTDKHWQHYEEDSILSIEKWRQFWIRITLDGSSIEVGKIGKPSFMSSKTEPRSIKYFGITSDSRCHWNFQCSKDTSIDLLRNRTLIARGYYYTFYPIADIKNDDGIFLKFDVKADYAHISFTENDDQYNMGPDYFEIFLNPFSPYNRGYSGILTKRDEQPAINRYEENILSSHEWRRFWIRITADGSSIEVGKNRQPAFMFLKTTPRTIKYFGFASDNGHYQIPIICQWVFSPNDKKPRANVLVFI